MLLVNSRKTQSQDWQFWYLTLLYGRRAFAVHGPMVWNSLPDDLRAQQDY